MSKYLYAMGIVLCLFFLLFCFSCFPYGYVAVKLLKNSGIRSITPPFDMTAYKFDVSFSRNGFSSVTLNDLAGNIEKAPEVELATGTWSIEARAYNEDAEIIGAGATSVNVVAGQTSEPTIVVSILPGNGTLSLETDWAWAGIDILDPSVEGRLTSISGNQTQLSFSISQEDKKATCVDNTIPAGSYTLELFLKEGSEILSSAIYTVQVVSEKTTSGAIVFCKDPKYWGKIIATIIVDMPEEVTFQFDPPSGTQVHTGIDTTITAMPSKSLDECRWYIDGILQEDQQGITFHTGTNLPVWAHTITIIGRIGSNLVSDSMMLEVIP